MPTIAVYDTKPYDREFMMAAAEAFLPGTLLE